MVLAGEKDVKPSVLTIDVKPWIFQWNLSLSERLWQMGVVYGKGIKNISSLQENLDCKQA